MLGSYARAIKWNMHPNEREVGRGGCSGEERERKRERRRKRRREGRREEGPKERGRREGGVEEGERERERDPKTFQQLSFSGSRLL